MKDSSGNLKVERFNAIYVENRAVDYPITRDVLARHPDCHVIPIRHYKDVFNRGNQSWEVQKERPSLILAVKEKPFLYKGPEVCQNFGHVNFHYVSFLLNCPFDCEYCYLQGMYPSAYPVAFVNTDDFENAMEELASNRPAYLAASYDTDLLAFRHVVPYTDYLYRFLEKRRNLLVEIRTKSAGKSFYSVHEPLDNLIIAFSLAPEEMIAKYEKGTPTLAARLKAVQNAIENGFKVRLCFDPIIAGPETDALYEPFFHYVFSVVDPADILDVGYGFFRMPRDYFRRIMKRRPGSRIYFENYPPASDIVTYPDETKQAILTKHMNVLSRYLDSGNIFVLPET